MKLDMGTLLLAQALSSLVQALALGAQFRLARAYRGQGTVVLAATLIFLGLLLYAFRGLGDQRAAIFILANSAFAFGTAFLGVGVFRFLGEPPRLRLLLSANALALLGVILFYLHDEPALRRILLSFAMGGTCLLVTLRLLAARRRSYGKAALLLGLVFSAYALVLLGRGGANLAVLLGAGPELSAAAENLLFLGTSLLGPLATFGFILLVNQRLHVENTEARRTQELIFDASPDAVLITRLADGMLVSANTAFYLLTGLSREEARGRSMPELGIWNRPEDRMRFAAELRAKGGCDNMEFDFRLKKGGLMAGLVSARILELEGVSHILSVTHDISERKAAEEALRESEAKFREMADLLPQIVFETDAGGRLTYINRQAYQICGYTEKDSLLGASTLDFYVPEDRERALDNISRRLAGQPMGSNEYRIVRKDGSVFPALVYSSVILREGRPAGLRGIIVDITEQKRAEEEISRLARQLELERNFAQASAMTDGLTRLANRRRFDELLRADFFRLKRSGACLSLLMLDIDFFKNYNDRYGHLAGDDCLRAVALAISTAAGRASDTAARYGGEEFAIILPETEAAGALVIAERIRRSVEDLGLVHEASAAAKVVTLSVGLATVTPAEMISPDEAIELADVALYKAKRGGRNRVERLEPAAAGSGRVPLRPSLLRLVWSPDDECGREGIDAQHRALFRISNELLDSLLGGSSKEESLRRLGDLLAEVSTHFIDEEALLRELAYPELPAHAELHAGLLAGAASLAERFQRDEATMGEIFNFLVHEVIAQHLLREDKKYFPYLGPGTTRRNEGLAAAGGRH